MRARFPASLFAAAWIVFIGPRCLGAAPASQPAVLNPAIRDLFDQLAAPSFADREDATQRLANYGELIRPALLDAAWHGAPAELRLRAARLLCGAPWTQADDPPPIRHALSEYRSADPDQRINAARRLAAVGGDAFPVLLRLLREEPSQAVRWVLAEQLRNFDGNAERAQLRRHNAGDDPPALAVVGWAWQTSDPERAATYFVRAVELFCEDPCEDAGEVDQILKTLYLRALNAGDYDEAAVQMRRMIWHSERPLSEALLDLFALHAQYGPRRGFMNDVQMAQDSFYSPEMMYVLGRMYERMDQPLLATATYRAAGLSALSSQATHKRLAEFLLTRQWFDLAEVEYRAVLATDGPEKGVNDADAYVGLSRCAAGLGDDAAAADLLTTGLRIAGALPNRAINNEREFRAEIDWHELRAAKARKDWGEVERHVNHLAEFHTSNPEVAIDLVTSLKVLGRDDEAAAVYGRFYAIYQKQLTQEPHDPDVLNNIAWLSARCGERMDEAARWSAEAIRLAPANAAYLDTAAEAVAGQGKWDEAIKLESAALKLQPGDRFMTAQLLRFREELAKAKQ